MFNHSLQGNPINCYIILGPGDKAAPAKSQQKGQFPPKRMKYRRSFSSSSSFFYFFFSLVSSSFFYSHRRAVFALNQSEARFAELDEEFPEHVERNFFDPERSFVALRTN